MKTNNKTSKNIFRKKTKTVHSDIFGVPENLGNAKVQQSELLSQVLLNKNTIKGLDIECSEYGGGNYKWYELLKFNAEYFVNRFNILSDIMQHEKLIYNSIYLGYLYGRSGIYKIGDKYQVGAVSSAKFNGFGELTEITLINGTLLLNKYANVETSLNDVYEKEKGDSKLIQVLKGNDLINFCLYEWDIYGTGSLLKFLKFSKSWDYWLTIINNQKTILKNTVLYEINNPKTSTQEMQLYHNPNVLVAARISNLAGGEIANEFKILELNSSISSQLKESYLLWKSEMFELMGREFLQDPKKERKIEAEIDQSNSSVNTIEYSYFIQIKDYADRLKILFNDDSIRAGNVVIDKETNNDDENENEKDGELLDEENI